ncbi:hypothetical protein ACFPRL_06310 [Pseudoclavibacter helvolus]
MMRTATAASATQPKAWMIASALLPRATVMAVTPPAQAMPPSAFASKKRPYGMAMAPARGPANTRRRATKRPKKTA